MPVVKMNKKEVVAEFKEFVLPNVIKRFGEKDKIALAEAWNDYTDALCKDGRITLKQYESWTNPF